MSATRVAIITLSRRDYALLADMAVMFGLTADVLAEHAVQRMLRETRQMLSKTPRARQVLHVAARIVKGGRQHAP
jgi:hypothetical protein